MEAGPNKLHKSLIFAASLPTHVTPKAVATKLGAWQEALQLLSSVGTSKDPGLCTTCISACGQAIAWRHALALLSGTPVPDAVMQGSVLGACAKASVWQQVLQLWQNFPAKLQRPNFDRGRALNSVLASLGRGEQHAAVLQVMRTELDVGWPRDGLAAFNVGLKALAQSWREALQVLEMLRSSACPLSPDVISYTTLITAVGGSAWRMALQLLQQAERAKEMDGIVVNSAIRACEQAAQWVIALHLLQRLVRGLAPPQVASFNTAAAACASAMQWQRSLWLIFEELSRNMEAPPNIISFNVAISACEKGSKWATALALMEAMPRRQLQATVSSYGALAASYEKAAKGLRALRLLERMQEVDPLLKLVFYTSLL
eukprot:s1102_g17.t2